MKNLITQKKMNTMNDYQFPEDSRDHKIMVIVGIIAGIGLIIIVSTISFAFMAGLVAFFTGGF